MAEAHRALRQALVKTPNAPRQQHEVLYNRVILVLKGVSLAVPGGGMVALLAANGAGKTATLNAISNCCVPNAARQRHDPVRRRPSAGTLAQRTGAPRLNPGDGGRHCFAHLTIEGNLLTEAFTQARRQAIRRDLDRVYFPRLRERCSPTARCASGGEQQMCAGALVGAYPACPPRRPFAMADSHIAA